jgi:exodeoxyribonuclease VII small subunit
MADIKINELSVEDAMKRLEAVVEKLSGEGISLEDSLALYEEGVALVKVCNMRLADAERKINTLKMNANGEIKEVPFDTAGII